ncbi:hypothetical protein CK203_050488 [Vitis vinifera]|uniref:RNase H type-1 domain-containing protein n=1 Tax=Vitis vinifera TaxID=29760 RepID=A0A438H2J7_VITVI|nr:hypothetical protein CK203_050488 [Vitis vinifera]
MTLCFSDEIDEHEIFAEIGDIVDGAVPHDEYVNEMLAMSLSQIEEIVSLELISPFDLFGVIVEGASYFVDPPLSFDVLSGFVSRHDNVFDSSSMDLSIFEYLSVSHVIVLSTPSSSISQIFDIDDEIAQHDSDDDSSSVSNFNLIDQRVSPTIATQRLLISAQQTSLGRDPKATQCRISISGRVPKVAGQCCPCSQKDGKVRVCVDFRDLNKASPKDDFPLPYIDMLVDVHQWGTYFYRVMPFGLKNTGATYQRAATTLFHDMMHRDVEIEIKSQEVHFRSDFWEALGIYDHLASLPVFDGRAIDDDFTDEDVATVTSLLGWRMYFDGAANHSGYEIGVLLISPHGDQIPRFVRLAFLDRHPVTNNIVKYEACIFGLETTLKLGIRQMEVSGDSNMFVDALATLASMIDIPTDANVPPLLIESRSVLVYCCLIDDTELDDGLPCMGHRHHREDLTEIFSGHEFILVAIDYFTKWVEVVCGAIEAMNKNIMILRRMVETSQDWSEKLPFALWAYRTSFRTSTGATPYSLVYDMEAVLPVEIEMGSLRVALKQ